MKREEEALLQRYGWALDALKASTAERDALRALCDRTLVYCRNAQPEIAVRKLEAFRFDPDAGRRLHVVGALDKAVIDTAGLITTAALRRWQFSQGPMGDFARAELARREAAK